MTKTTKTKLNWTWTSLPARAVFDMNGPSENQEAEGPGIEMPKKELDRLTEKSRAEKAKVETKGNQVAKTMQTAPAEAVNAALKGLPPDRQEEMRAFLDQFNSPKNEVMIAPGSAPTARVKIAPKAPNQADPAQQQVDMKEAAKQVIAMITADRGQQQEEVQVAPGSAPTARLKIPPKAPDSAVAPVKPAVATGRALTLNEIMAMAGPKANPPSKPAVAPPAAPAKPAAAPRPAVSVDAPTQPPAYAGRSLGQYPGAKEAQTASAPIKPPPGARPEQIVQMVKENPGAKTLDLSSFNGSLDLSNLPSNITIVTLGNNPNVKLSDNVMTINTPLSVAALKTAMRNGQFRVSPGATINALGTQIIARNIPTA